MIETKLSHVRLMVLVIGLCGLTSASVWSIDRTEDDSTRVEDTLPSVPAAEDTTVSDEPPVELSPMEAEMSNREPQGIGDFTIGFGYSAPQGTFTRYADVGFHALARATIPTRERSPLAFWVDFTFTYFKNEDRQVYIEYESSDEYYYGDAKEVLDETAYALHLGLQLGNPTRRAFFRPRAAIGAGFYVFATGVKYIALDGREDDELTGFKDQVLGRFGWRGVLGADFFFTPRWGIAVDLHYDHVLHMHLTAEAENRNLTARFQGIAIGVIFAHQHLE